MTQAPQVHLDRSPREALAPEALYPLGLALAGRRVLVAGGGSVAWRRVAALLAAGAYVVVVAPEATAALEELADTGQVEWHRRTFTETDLDAAWLAFACTSDPEVNAAVAEAAERRRLFCSRADAGGAGSARVPAVGRSGPVTVAVNAGDPRRGGGGGGRRADAAGTGAVRRARRGRGQVVLVGGGPGDPGLITVAGRAALAEADVVVADRLAPVALLDELAPSVRVIDAAKVPGGRSMSQEEINRLLVTHALDGHVVVRLKGGDPFVFGRGMEEVLACTAAGVPVEVVPGVSSAVAVPALAGIPVTCRGVVQAFTTVSGHVPPGDPRSTVDWAALARAGSTLVVLMGVDTMPAIAAALLAGGMGADTPVACVGDGAGPRQRTLRTTLAEVGADVVRHGVRPPVVFVIGEVAGLAPATVDALARAG